MKIENFLNFSWPFVVVCYIHPHREAFNGLDEKGRRGILGGPLDEIVRLLEENLLQRFWQIELQRQGTYVLVVVCGEQKSHIYISLLRLRKNVGRE